MRPRVIELRHRKGAIRIFQLLSSLVGLVLIIIALSFHRTESFIGFEASFSTILSLTTVRSIVHTSHLTRADEETVLLDARVVDRRHLCPHFPRQLPCWCRRRT